MDTPIDREKLRTVGTISRRTGDRVREWHDDSGRHKAVTDELGNTVTQHAAGDRQDVLIRAPRITVQAQPQ